MLLDSMNGLLSSPGQHCYSISSSIKFLPTVYPKIFEVENFHRFRRSEQGHKNFLHKIVKFITDAGHGWKVNREKFILFF